MKRIKILALKGFDVVYVYFIVGEWCGILVYIDNRKVRKHLCNQKHKFP
jgi:hypothetical protein